MSTEVSRIIPQSLSNLLSWMFEAQMLYHSTSRSPRFLLVAKTASIFLKVYVESLISEMTEQLSKGHKELISHQKESIKSP